MTRGGNTNHMKMSDALIPEFDHELATTRKLLERVPEDKFGWTPHEKSMNMGKLACHVASIPYFATQVSKADSLDFAKGEYKEIEASNRQQLLDNFDQTAAEARAALAGISDAEMMKTWALQMNGQTLMSMPKVAVIRTVMMNHLIHHRGQLSVYLRLTNTPVPSIYGPSGDEGQM
jgi:uncharacterized damage-inducible protein DinB